MKQNLEKNSRLIELLICFFVVSLISQGCKKTDQQPEPAQVAKTAPVPAKPQVKPVQKPISSVARMTLAPVNQFDFSTKKDPFKPYIVVKSVSVSSKERRRMDDKAALPIHRFDVSQFKLIGIVTGGKENQAMVTDPNGKGYVLRVGMTIGKNDGRVISVTNSGVDILEQFRDDNGKVRKEHIKLALPRKF
jgi:type IV pilus assembly protein PilP